VTVDYDDDAPAGMIARLAARLPPGILRSPGTTAQEEAEYAQQIAPGGGRREVRYIARQHANVVALRQPTEHPGKLFPGKPSEHVPPAVVDPLSLVGAAIPPRRWIVPNWLPVGYATLLYGEGGTGKSLLAQQLLTSCATGAPWLGLSTEACRTFALFCEDDADEVHLRQSKINARLGIGFQDIGNMIWTCPVGESNILIKFDRSGEPTLTDRFKWLKDEILSFGARIALIDTVATTFGGNENDRMHTTAFVGQALTSLAQEMDGAVLVNAHPSRNGMRDGSGESGSTGWVGSARSVWTFGYPQIEVGNGKLVSDKQANDRILTRTKVNGASRGAQITSQWSDWFFDVRGATEMLAAVSAAVTREAEIDGVFLELLDKSEDAQEPLSISPNSTSFAPRVFEAKARAAPGGQKISKAQFKGSMHRLLGKGTIWNGGTYKVNGVSRQKLERKPEDMPAQQEGDPSGKEA